MEKSVEEQNARQSLTKLRDGLMALHKTLIDSERIGYEQTFGAIPSPTEFLRLLMHDSWFVWLRPLSGLISTIDEALDADEPMSKTEADALIKKARELLVPTEQGEGFGRHYFIAIQRDPDVLLAHAAVTKLNKS